MTIKVQSSLVIAAMLCATIVQAKTATEVFEKVSPSVVVIKTYDAKGNGHSLGSGVVLEDGMVVTNCHVVKDAATMQVEGHGMKLSATLRNSDWDRDICTLTVDGLKGQTATKGSTSHLKVGEKVYAVGAPKGLELTLSDGLISSLRQVEGGQYLQITAPISPGSSGGGLFDDEGRLIGQPTFYLSDGQQLNFAVPVEWVNELPKRNAPPPKVAKMTTTEWMNKAVEFEKKKDLPGMIKHGLRWTTAQPKDAVAWDCLGTAYGESNQPAKAIDAFQQSLRINQENAATWYNLGFTYNQSNQPDKAIDAYQQAIRINPDYARAWYSLGVAYGQAGQDSKSIAALQQAIRIKPDNADAWYHLGLSYGQASQTPKSIEALQQAISINPKNAGAWVALGFGYQLSGQTSKVMEVYKRLKTLDPELADKFFNKIVLP